MANAVALAPFPHGLFRRPVAPRKNPSRFVARLDRRSDLRRRGRGQTTTGEDLIDLSDLPGRGFGFDDLEISRRPAGT
ncbi:hypothetical protein [Pseudophaeobacter sp. C1-32P7]|uniref:hypothetical protein n=1 Tax=Pseudophaeobacter sp. C1-32P7 TaxID=3098142 RepID=UPI0034D69030